MSILGALAGAAVQATLGKVIDGLAEAFKAYQQRKITEEQLRRQVEGLLMDFAVAVVREQAGVIRAEMVSDSWLARNWRPIAMLSFLFVALWFTWLMPVLVSWFGAPPVTGVSDALLLQTMQWLGVGIAGYAGGRSLEKIARIIKGR